MDWKELAKSIVDSPNMSRKALVVLMGIIAIIMIMPEAPAEGQSLDPQIFWCTVSAIAAVLILCLFEIGCQTLLDNKWPKRYDPNLIEIDEIAHRIAEQFEKAKPDKVDPANWPETVQDIESPAAKPLKQEA